MLNATAEVYAVVESLATIGFVGVVKSVQ